jgi:hypothetical protein
MFAKNQSPGSAFSIPILHEIALYAGWLYADAEAPQLAIPSEYVPIRVGAKRIHGAFEQFCH